MNLSDPEADPCTVTQVHTYPPPPPIVMQQPKKKKKVKVERLNVQCELNHHGSGHTVEKNRKKTRLRNAEALKAVLEVKQHYKTICCNVTFYQK